MTEREYTSVAQMKGSLATILPRPRRLRARQLHEDAEVLHQRVRLAYARGPHNVTPKEIPMALTHQRRLHRMRRLRGAVPEQRDQRRLAHLRHRPGEVHRMRRRERRAAVHRRVPRRLHRSRPEAQRNARATAGQVRGSARPSFLRSRWLAGEGWDGQDQGASNCACADESDTWRQGAPAIGGRVRRCAATMLGAMYKKFFGLKQEPFSIAPDPHYLFMSERHREALAHLLYGVRGGGGFVLLTGEIGAGKTTVCRCFLEQVPRRSNVAYIFNPRQTAEELLESICDDFRIPRDIDPARVPSGARPCRRAERLPAAHPRRGPEQRADHRRGAEPVGRGAGADAAADQPGNQRAQAAADHPDRPARAARHAGAARAGTAGAARHRALPPGRADAARDRAVHPAPAGGVRA